MQEDRANQQETLKDTEEKEKRTRDGLLPPSFLSRFVGSIRGSNERPNLSRTVSSPVLPTEKTRSLKSSVGSSSPKASTSAINFKRFRRPSASTANSISPSSAPTSPMYSNSIASLDYSPTYSTASERDPMELATPISKGLTGRGISLDMMKNDSDASERTVQKDLMAIPSPLKLSRAVVTTEVTSTPTTIAGPATQQIESPLLLVSTLLPPALLLLSQLGPTHLFSPPLILPSLETIFNSPSSFQPSLPDTASHDMGSSASSFSLPPPLPTFYNPTPSYSHELHAASTLSVPAISAAAIWRIFRGLEWVTELENEPTVAGMFNSALDEEEKVFDFPSVLQGVADALAADAARRGVELVIGRIGFGSAPSPATTPTASDPLVELAPIPKVKEFVTRELLLRADERAWSVALIWILHHILASSENGATVEVRFNAGPTSPPVQPEIAVVDSQDTAVPTRASLRQWWTVSLEIICTPPVSSSRLSTSSIHSSNIAPSEPPFNTSFARSLLSYLEFSLDFTTKDNDRIWNMSMILPGAQPAPIPLEEPATLLERRRASLENSGREPTMTELKSFADTGLKGVKVELRSGETSAFAKHLTTYLAGWGMDVSHVALDAEEVDTVSMTGSSNGDAWHARRGSASGTRSDSGFGGSNSTDPPSAHISPIDSNAKSLHDSIPSTSIPNVTDPLANFIIVDDDIATLKRLLISYRAPSILSYAPSLLNKRPQLSSRRTRSSNHVRQVTHSPSIIIHFASLTHYKAIKEAIQDAVATTKSTTLPEVLVVPKPAGPRRIITALWTAMKRPTVDPSLAPIATSPTSPGVQYWTPRLSPAISNQQDFDSAAAEALAKDGNSAGPSRSRTPPSYFSSTPSGHPPSPLGKISDEQVSYFSCVAETMDGTSPSEGMVVQSPNGRPAIFFQPMPRGVRSGSTIKREMDLGEGQGGSSIPLISPTVIKGGISAPHEIGLGQDRRKLNTTNSPDSPFFLPLGTPALSLDSFIANANSRGNSGSSSPEIIKSPALQPIDTASAFQRSNSVNLARSASPRAGSNNASPRSITSPVLLPIRPRANSPPVYPNVDSPATGTTLPRPLGINLSPHRSVSLPSVLARSRRNTVRKSPLPTVPPINVLIVEDNPINQTILSMFMKKKGIRYAVASNGEEAVQKWKGGNFDLVLMDIQLPVKDGIQATLEIRELERLANLEAFPRTPLSPLSATLSPTSSEMSSQFSSQSSPSALVMPVIIVALTASSLNADRVLGLQSGMNDFLTKPVSLKWLESKIREWGSLSLLGRGGRGGKEIRGGKEERFRGGVKVDDVASKLHLPKSVTSPPQPLPKAIIEVDTLDVAKVDAKLDNLLEDQKTPIRPSPLVIQGDDDKSSEPRISRSK